MIGHSKIFLASLFLPLSLGATFTDTVLKHAHYGSLAALSIGAGCLTKGYFTEQGIPIYPQQPETISNTFFANANKNIIQPLMNVVIHKPQFTWYARAATFGLIASVLNYYKETYHPVYPALLAGLATLGMHKSKDLLNAPTGVKKWFQYLPLATTLGLLARKYFSKPSL